MMKIANKIIVGVFPYLVTWFAFLAFKNGFMWITTLFGLMAFFAWMIVAGDIMKKQDHGRND